MMEWLKKVRAPKFYRYWYYRQYMLSKSLGDDDAEHSSTIGSAMLICLQYLGIGSYLLVLTGYKNALLHFIRPLTIKGIIYFIIVLLLCYWLFFFNEKWQHTLSEFQREKKVHKKWGNYYTVIYIGMNIAIFIFLATSLASLI